MNCSTQESSGAVDAATMARLVGAGIPVHEILTEASLEGLLHDILINGFGVGRMTIMPTHYHLPRQIFRRYRHSPAMRAIPTELVEDGFVPKPCIRAHCYGDYVLVDRRRGRRIQRRVREYSIQRRK